MKKLLFSAIALVAFSSVSMGNTKEMEGETFQNLIGLKATSCMQVYAETYQAFVDLGLEEEAAGEAASAYGECISGKGYSLEP